MQAPQMPRTSNAPVVRPESVVELVAQLHTVIHHDLQGHPCPVEDQFTGSSGNPGFTNSTKTTWCWPTAREVAISHTRLMDCIPFPSSWISAWKLAISPPVTLVIYAPVNAAAAAGLVVDPQLAAGVPQPPAGWVAAAVLPGCKWCKGKRQANNEKHHFGSTLALQREGMVEALEVLQRAEGRAPWWAVTARWVSDYVYCQQHVPPMVFIPFSAAGWWQLASRLSLPVRRRSVCLGPLFTHAMQRIPNHRE
jgi:hypothetical protein